MKRKFTKNSFTICDILNKKQGMFENEIEHNWVVVVASFTIPIKYICVLKTKIPKALLTCFFWNKTKFSPIVLALIFSAWLNVSRIVRLIKMQPQFSLCVFVLHPYWFHSNRTKIVRFLFFFSRFHEAEWLLCAYPSYFFLFCLRG